MSNISQFPTSGRDAVRRRAAPATAAGSGWWLPGTAPVTILSASAARLAQLDKPLFVVATGEGPAVAGGGEARFCDGSPGSEWLPVLALLPPLLPQQLGAPGFAGDHGVRFPYMTGSMANGIGSVALVTAVARRGVLGSFGAAGLLPDAVEKAIGELQSELAGLSYCFNLIYSPNERGREEAIVALYLRRGVCRVEASAYMALTLPVVHYRVSGIAERADGSIHTPNRIIAKASRVEIASKWLSPPPAELLAELVRRGDISEQQARLAANVPMAGDLTVEADSGGHTDNRPAIALLPTMIALRDRLQEQFGYPVPVRVGAAGGIATPASAAAAFAMGAAYVVTGTVNQACLESGSSDCVRRMLAEAEQADVAMAPAVDMFELGVKLQVLKRGTMFPMRANKLWELYNNYDSIDAIPAIERTQLEKTIFRAPIDEIWTQTRRFFMERDPEQVKRAGTNPKYKMALLFRWYLGLSSRWANAGEPTRQMDYQVWCGPAMGAFNEWTRGTFLAEPEQRSVLTVAYNILFGAALVTRLNQLHYQGVPLPAHLRQVRPRPLAELADVLDRQ